MSSTTPARTPSPELSSAPLKSSPATATEGPPEPVHKSMSKKSKNEDEEEEEGGEPITPPATPKAKGNKRKAASSTTAKAEKATKKPRAEADDAASANRGGWEPEHTALVQRMKAEGKSWPEIVGALKEIFGVDKKPKAAQMHFNRTQAKTFEWTEELEQKLIASVEEFLSQKSNKYQLVNGIFQSKGLGCAIKAEAVMAKLKAMEKEGTIEKLS